MSEIKVNSIKGVGASAAAITVNNTDGTCTANITNNLSNKNLVVNGACLIAQRGTSSTTSGIQTVDRFSVSGSQSGWDEAMTQSQSDVASGTTPYTLGFRKAFKLQNGNQTSGANASDEVGIYYKIEAQDIANSGWNYLSSSSYITLSFWVKASVAQNYYGYLYTYDGSSYLYPFETGSLSADTWTKVTKTISGNSNLTFDNDNGSGLLLVLATYLGTDKTGSVSLDAWGAFNSSVRVPDMTSTWFTTNDATFEITGLQLEVSDHATDFEHRSFGQELALCQRYFFKFDVFGGNTKNFVAAYGNSYGQIDVHFPVTMRTSPSGSLEDISGVQEYRGGTWNNRTLAVRNTSTDFMQLESQGSDSLAQYVRASSGTPKCSCNAEL